MQIISNINDLKNIESGIIYVPTKSLYELLLKTLCESKFQRETWLSYYSEDYEFAIRIEHFEVYKYDNLAYYKSQSHFSNYNYYQLGYARRNPCYRVGDIVKICSKLRPKCYYGGVYYNQLMVEHNGETHVIKEVLLGCRYKVVVNELTSENWCYSNNMLENIIMVKDVEIPCSDNLALLEYKE